MDLRRIAADIPDYKTFMTVDEMTASSHQLAADYPNLVTLREVGRTRRGDPIELITIVGGPLQAFVFGGPHPNEPIGCMTIEYLTRKLCADGELRRELGFTWHFIKTIDADGMRLNEGWFKGPFTPTNYARHFYRPEPAAQVEWTFPVAYKNLHFNRPLPETEALMRVIDEVKPEFMYSLHNAGFGGVYYYVARDCAPLYPIFHELPGWFGLALDLGEPEASNAVTLAPAVYQWLSVQDSYDHLEQNGVEDPASVINSGGSSDGYARPHGTFTLIVEMPYYDDPRVNDQSLTDIPRRTAMLERIDEAEAFDAITVDQLAQVQPYLTLKSSVRDGAEVFLAMMPKWREAERAWVMNTENTLRPATQAERFSSQIGSRFYAFLIFGMFARMLRDEIAAGNTHPVVVEMAENVQARMEVEGADIESKLQYRALPIQGLVGVQVCAGLATAAYLRDVKATQPA